MHTRILQRRADDSRGRRVHYPLSRFLECLTARPSRDSGAPDLRQQSPHPSPTEALVPVRILADRVGRPRD